MDSQLHKDSSSSSTPSTVHDKNIGHTTSQDGYELQEVKIDTTDAEAQSLRQPQRQKWWEFVERRLVKYSRLRKAFVYVRGPRPKVELPESKPYLDVDVCIKGRRIVIPIESTWLRATRILTSPWLFAVLVAGYIIGLAFFVRAQSYLTPADSFIGCTSTYWLANNQCGLDGANCAPFNNTSLDFRCPAQCMGVVLQNPRTVGDEEMDLKPLVVGGGDADATYRGDSFICAAAIQQGLVSNSKGGCGTLDLVGEFANFLPTSANGVDSIGFDTVFPLAYRFRDSTSLSHCQDLRNEGLAFNILVTCSLFLLFRPRAIILFWCLICIGFWHISFFSQPQQDPPDISTQFSIFLPALFFGYGIWRMAVRYTMPLYRKAPIEYMVWYLGPYWTSVLTNLTMNNIPFSRLTASDLTKRSGAITALVIIVLIILVLGVNQARVIRKTGWLPYYLGWYIIGGLIVLVIALLPTLELRIHHYILALMILPLTAFPTKLSAIYQGFCIGLFLNGGAAYGFDSILQTAAQLRQDATLGSDLPTFLTNSTTFDASIPLINQTFAWASAPEGWDGFSLLVDDVERFSGAALNFSLGALNASLPHFFRLALTSQGSAGDFTNAATLWPNGTWVDPAPGGSY
ncbi:hypothetical protein CYLTODRAFT_378156 [Cylindrobasidium torrendii FP15055 ss-10]|uniref:LCCL domain-containing protein n=1 Tax=Cylindrobasidium torrendii FP15055 ss-10 TaxID=1314674 RepID=A0A0D7B9E0_9AGAR|nr:hypothetical protein CYLTODRAFT_378156 [Cylindrobasidium torrendii FP15055 ss-10]